MQDGSDYTRDQTLENDGSSPRGKKLRRICTDFCVNVTPFRPFRTVYVRPIIGLNRQRGSFILVGETKGGEDTLRETTRVGRAKQ